MPSVRVRMKVAMAGPGLFRRPGFVYELDGEEAGSLVAAGYATLEPVPPKLTPAAAPAADAKDEGDEAEDTTADGPPESTSGAPADRPAAPPAAGGKDKGGRRGRRG